MLAYTRAFATGFMGSLPMAGAPEMPTFSFACSSARVAAIVAVVALGCIFRMSVGRSALAGSGAVLAIAAFALSGGCTLAEGMPFALLAGVASGIVMLSMLMLLSSMGIRDIVASAFGGLVVGGLLIGALMRADALPALILLVVSGLVSGLFFLALDPKAAFCRADGVPNAGQAARFPWFAAIAFAVSGAVISLFYGVSETIGFNAAGQVNYPLFGIAVVAALGVSAYIVLQGEEAVVAAWIPIFAILLTAMALACFDIDEVDPSVTGLLFAGVFAYHFLRWMVFPALITVSGMPRLLICGIVLICTSSAFGVGWGEATAPVLPDGLRSQGSFVAVLAIALLVFFAAALWVNRTRLERSEMQLQAADMELAAARGRLAEAQGRLDALAGQIDAAADAQASVEDRCAAIASERDLTPREAEILVLTARGHSSTFIAGQLFISASTVRFHQQNIYRKLDVHSRQELLAVVNGEEEQR